MADKGHRNSLPLLVFRAGRLFFHLFIIYLKKWRKYEILMQYFHEKKLYSQTIYVIILTVK